MPKFNWKRFAQVVKTVAPIILVTVNPALAPIAATIADAISEAEAIPGATGPDKLQHVKNIVAEVAPTIPGVDEGAVNASLENGVNTVISVTKVLEKTHTP